MAYTLRYWGPASEVVLLPEMTDTIKTLIAPRPVQIDRKLKNALARACKDGLYDLMAMFEGQDRVGFRAACASVKGTDLGSYKDLGGFAKAAKEALEPLQNINMDYVALAILIVGLAWRAKPWRRSIFRFSRNPASPAEGHTAAHLESRRFIPKPHRRIKTSAVLKHRHDRYEYKYGARRSQIYRVRSNRSLVPPGYLQRGFKRWNRFALKALLSWPRQISRLMTRPILPGLRWHLEDIVETIYGELSYSFICFG